MLRLFAAITGAILITSRLYARVKINIIILKNLLVYSVNSKEKIKYDCI